MKPNEFLTKIIEAGLKRDLPANELAECIKESLRILREVSKKSMKDKSKKDSEKILLKGSDDDKKNIVNDTARRLGTRYEKTGDLTREEARPAGSAKGGYLVIIKNKTTGAVKREPETLPFVEANAKAEELKTQLPDYEIFIKPANPNLMSIPSDKEVVRKRGRPVRTDKVAVPIAKTDFAKNKEELDSNFEFTGVPLAHSENWHFGFRLNTFGNMYPGYDITRLKVRDLNLKKSGFITSADNKDVSKAQKITVTFGDGSQQEYLREIDKFKKLWIVGGDRVNVREILQRSGVIVLRESMEDTLKVLGYEDGHFFVVQYLRKKSGSSNSMTGYATVVGCDSKEEAIRAAAKVIPEDISQMKLSSPLKMKDSEYLVNAKSMKLIEF